MNALTIDTPRLLRELETLAGFSNAEGPPPAVTRILWTAPDLDARAYVKSLFTDAGLTIRTDPIGNIFARWEGARPELAPVGTGSHTDAIPESGRYDGTLGVLGALEAFRALQASGFSPVRSLEILLFTAEEPTRFGLGCLGSRLLSGALTPERAAVLADSDGNSLEQVRRAAGETGDLADVPLPADYYSAWVELHIEQGRVLEWQEYEIGAVTSIAAPATLRVTLIGQGGHAGTVLMSHRRDALLAAAEIVLAVEKAAVRGGGADTVATTGVLKVYPGAVNSIPSQVIMEIDIRDVDLKRRTAVIARIRASIDGICTIRHIESAVEVLNADPPAICSPTIVKTIASCADKLSSNDMSGYDFVRRVYHGSYPLVSRAYHDTLFMARIAPVGMIFIPCRGGVSHRPDEYSSPEQMERGVAVLAHTLASLSTMEMDWSDNDNAK